MRIEELSGDSSITGLKYEEGKVSFLYEDYESEKQYEICIETKSFKSECAGETGTVHLELIKLSDFVPVDLKSKVYVMPAEFGAQMKINRKGFNIALGLKMDEYPIMFVVQGNQRILVCPIRSEKEININEV